MAVRARQPSYSWDVIELIFKPGQTLLLIQDQILIRGICFIGGRPTSVDEFPAPLFQQFPKFSLLLFILSLPPHAEKLDFTIRKFEIWAKLHFLSD